MSIDEIIKALTAEGSAYEEMAAVSTVADSVKKRWEKRAIAMREAIALLKTHPYAQPNEPLTLEELLEMDGQPTWCEEEKHWGIVFVTQCGSCGLVPFFWALNHEGDFMFDIEKRQLTLFRRPSKED